MTLIASVVHRTVTVRHILERPDAIEDATGLDPSLEYVRKELLQVRPRRRGASADRHVVEERRLAFRDRRLLRLTDTAAGRALWRAVFVDSS